MALIFFHKSWAEWEQILTIIIRPFGFLAPKHFLALKYFVFSLPDEGYSINAPYSLYLISIVSL
jgi:hypothetical protein